VRGTYRGYEVASTAPPSPGGVHVVELLNILEGFPLREQGLNSAATIHWPTRIARLTSAILTLFASRSGRDAGDRGALDC
jgi:gamma-glutamyltranspeptidase/glutathione hydrolase